MPRARVLALAGGGAVAAAVLAAVVFSTAGATSLPSAAPAPDLPVAAGQVPPAAPPPATEAAAQQVSWLPGPWPAVTLAGHPALVPSSPVHGPLVDHGQGWSSGFTPDPTGAAIAALRTGLFVVAAPPSLRPAVLAASLTPEHAALYIDGEGLNASPDWAIPAQTAAAIASAGEATTLGALARVEPGGTTLVEVYLSLVPPGDLPVARTVRTTHRLQYEAGEWRMLPPQPQDAAIEVAAPPQTFTVRGPAQEQS